MTVRIYIICGSHRTEPAIRSPRERTSGYKRSNRGEKRTCLLFGSGVGSRDYHNNNKMKRTTTIAENRAEYRSIRKTQQEWRMRGMNDWRLRKKESPRIFTREAVRARV